jgi:hypothetical protein
MLRSLINKFNRKVSAILGTARIPDIFQTVSRLHEVSESILIDDFLEDKLFKNPKYIGNNRLTRHHSSVYTQNGEDGIIQEIFKRIGTRSKFFVEFGVHGIKNNSTYLLTKAWKGAWIGGNNIASRNAQKNFSQLLANDTLRFKNAWINKDNIEDLFDSLQVPKQFDLLSIDLDGNDYWIWQAITKYKPRVVIIEYNATFPADSEWIMEYNDKHIWKGNSYFGASLKSLTKLGEDKGYKLVGCDFNGCNAFFIDEKENLSLFESPFSAENHYEPPRYHLRKSSGHKQGFGSFITQE